MMAAALEKWSVERKDHSRLIRERQGLERRWELEHRVLERPWKVEHRVLELQQVEEIRDCLGVQ
jgi:hypothetical protein